MVLADSRSFHTERYVAELRRQGCKVFVASLEHGHMHHYHLRKRGPIRQLHYMLAATEVRELVHRIRPDVINPHFASGYGFLAAVAGVRTLAPIVTNLWGSDILLVPEKSVFHRRKTAYALSQSDFLAGDSQYLIDAAAKIAPLKKSSVIPWGIESSFLTFHRSTYKLTKPLRIIVPRPHEKVYNNLFLVRALAPLANDGLLELTFPAAGSLLGHFTLHARSMIGDRLHIYERLPRDRFMEFMAAHDVYLSSALSDSSPASMIEAMGLGLLPITADIPGVREWLSNDNGFLYEPYNEKALRNIVEWLIRNDDPKDTWRTANLERVKREAVFENNVATMIRIMSDLAARRQS